MTVGDLKRELECYPESMTVVLHKQRTFERDSLGRLIINENYLKSEGVVGILEDQVLIDYDGEGKLIKYDRENVLVIK